MGVSQGPDPWALWLICYWYLNKCVRCSLKNYNNWANKVFPVPLLATSFPFPSLFSHFFLVTVDVCWSLPCKGHPLSRLCFHTCQSSHSFSWFLKPLPPLQCPSLTMNVKRTPFSSIVPHITVQIRTSLDHLYKFQHIFHLAKCLLDHRSPKI